MACNLDRKVWRLVGGPRGAGVVLRTACCRPNYAPASARQRASGRCWHAGGSLRRRGGGVRGTAGDQGGAGETAGVWGQVESSSGFWGAGLWEMMGSGSTVEKQLRQHREPAHGALARPPAQGTWRPGASLSPPVKWGSSAGSAGRRKVCKPGSAGGGGRGGAWRRSPACGPAEPRVVVVAEVSRGGGGDAAATVSAGRLSGAGLAPAQLFRPSVAHWARAVGGLPPRPSWGAPREPQDRGLCLGASRCGPLPSVPPLPLRPLSSSPCFPLTFPLSGSLLSPPDSLPSSPWIS